MRAGSLGPGRFQITSSLWDWRLLSWPEVSPGQVSSLLCLPPSPASLHLSPPPPPLWLLSAYPQKGGAFETDHGPFTFGTNRCSPSLSSHEAWWVVGRVTGSSLHHASCITALVHFEVQSLRKAMPKNAQTTAKLHSFHTLGSNAQNSPSQASTVCELPDVQAGFRKGKGTRDQIANIHWIIEKVREFQKNIYFLLLYWLCQSLWLCE